MSRVLALFDSPMDVQYLLGELVDFGFDPGQIEILTRNTEMPANRLADVTGRDAAILTEGLRRGGTVVSLEVDDPVRAEHVAEIMSAHNALDIDRRARAWELSGWTRPDAPAAPPPRTRASEIPPSEQIPLETPRQSIYQGAARATTARIYNPP